MAELMYSVVGAYGGEAFKRGTYTQTNGNTGSFHDRSYKRLSQNAKSHYNFTKDLKALKKAGIATTVILGSIEVSNGISQDYKNYVTTGYTDGRHTTIATVKVGTGVAVGWASGALVGAAFVSSFPIIGTIVGAAVGGYLGYLASEEAGKYMEKVYD